MATILGNKGGDDPVIIEDPGSGGPPLVLLGGLRIKAGWELKSLESGRFHPTWHCKAVAVTIKNLNDEILYGPYLNPVSIIVNMSEALMAGVFSFSGSRVLNIDPPTEMNRETGPGFSYICASGGNIASIVIDGTKFDVRMEGGVRVVIDPDEA